MMDVLNLGDRKENNKISMIVQDVRHLKSSEERKTSESSAETIQRRKTSNQNKLCSIWFMEFLEA